MCSALRDRYKIRMDRVALPFCHIQLQAQKHLSRAYPHELKTLGDHLRKKRLDLELLQEDVAKILGTNKASIVNWETNLRSPHIGYVSRIIDFIGYVPFESISDMSLDEKITTCRKIKGITQGQLAKQLGFDPGTVAQRENYHRKPAKSYLAALNAFLDPIISGV